MGILSHPARAALALAACVGWLGCAHAPAPPPVDAPAWPPPPAQPVVRWAGAFPDERFKPPGPPLWRRVLEVIAGLEPQKADDGLLRRPFGIAALETGFAIADPDARAVLKVDWRRGSYVELSCPEHDWRMPMAVAAGPSGELYVADAGAGLVLRLAPDGRCTALGGGALERPTGLAFSAGLLWVVDPPKHQVVAFGPDGRERLRAGKRGDGEGGLNFPTGLAALSDGTLLVVDALNFRVVHLAADGHFIEAFGTPGDGEGAFGRPKAIATDHAGRIFVADAQNDVVVMFSAAKAFELALGGTGTAIGQLLLPAGLAVGDGYLYVANSYNHRIEIFQLVGGEPP